MFIFALNSQEQLRLNKEFIFR